MSTYRREALFIFVDCMTLLSGVNPAFVSSDYIYYWSKIKYTIQILFLFDIYAFGLPDGWTDIARIT